jgi:hypothetical protein
VGDLLGPIGTEGPSTPPLNIFFLGLKLRLHALLIGIDSSVDAVSLFLSLLFLSLSVFYFSTPPEKNRIA